MGKIVVIEGTDFSGKSTQYELLLKRLADNGINVGSDSFPNYDSQSSFFVTSYLRGTYGDNAKDISPKVASSFYTLDRYHSFKTREWGKIYRDGGNILFARYLTSNILHQAAKYDTWKEKKDYIDWLYEYECGLFGIPREDCTILLNMPPKIAQELKAKRLKEQNGLSSSGEVKDIHEENKEYLMAAYDTAIKVSKYLNWKIVSCVNEKGELRSVEDISDEIYKIVVDVFQSK